MSLTNYTPEVEKRVESTILTLRQMRNAGIGANHESEKNPGPAEILKEAEELAKRQAFYLLNLITGGPTEDMLQSWQELESELREKYQSFNPVKKAISVSKPTHIALMAVSAALAPIHENDPSVLTYIFVSKPDVAKMQFSDLMDKKLGILAPLSTDLVIASLIPPFFELHHGRENVPSVKPVLISPDLRTITLPRDAQGAPVFANMERVLVFVDNKGTGETRMALELAATAEYPGKVIPGVR